jgi:sugar phosphate isomerase/epimerase
MEITTFSIAAQLWTVRSLCGDAKGFASTLTALKSIGYDAVELAGLANIPADAVRRTLDEAGITVCSAHADSQQLLEDPGAVIETLHSLGCSSAVYPHPRNQDFSSVEGVTRLCRRLSEVGSLLNSEGIAFSYHNHSLELQRLGERTILQMILDQTDPKIVGMELDTYWLQAGGVDPAKWIEKCRERVTLLHVKDYRINADGKPLFAEIGTGNLDWEGILSAAGKAGSQWLIVEQDDHWTGGDPVASLRTSWKYLSLKLSA